MDLLVRHIPSLEHRTALVCGDRELTWGALFDEVSRLSSGLRDRQLSGQLLALWLPNSAELLICILACLRAGVVPMPLPAQLKWPEVRSILGQARARSLVTTASRATALADELRAAALDLHVVGEGGGFPVLDELMAPHGAAVPASSAQDETGLVLHTSGTSGRQKGVMISRRSISHILEYRLAHTALDENSVSVVASCLSQSVGLYQVLALVAAGAKTVLLKDYEVERLADCINRHEPTHLIMVVDAFDRLLQHPRITRASLAGLRFAAVGADRVTARVQNRFIELTGRPLCTTYGLTESSWALVNLGDGVDKMLSLGRPGAGIEVGLRDQAGNEVPAGEVGEIWIRSARTMLGYLNDEASTRETFRGSWLASGDLAWRDAEGYFWFAGRSKNIIVLSSGDTVSPVEVENALLGHPLVSACAVVGVAAADGSEIPLAFVTRRDEGLSGADLQAFLSDRISNAKIPRRFMFLPALPVGSAGKVRRDELKRLAVEAMAAATA